MNIHKAVFFDFTDEYYNYSKSQQEGPYFNLRENVTSLSSGTSFIFKKDFKLNNMRDTIVSSIQDNVSLENNDDIYLTPLCKIPRYRIDNYISEAKLKIKKSYSFNTINKLFLDRKETETLLNRSVGSREIYYIPKDIFLELKNKLEAELRYQDSNYKYQIFDESKIKQDYIGLIIYMHSSGKGTKAITNFLSSKNITPVSIMSTTGSDMKEIQFLIELYGYLLKGNNKFIVANDSSIIKQTNSELAIEEDTYNSLRDMLSSTNQSNINVAKEIIANCDYEKSHIWLMFLLHEFTSKLFGGTKSGNYNMFLSKYRPYKSMFKSQNWYNFSFDLLAKFPEHKEEIKRYMIKRFNTQAGREIVVDIILKD